MATIKVRIEITFSAPLSLVLTKTLRPPPVIAPEAPSDLPPWSKQRTMMMTLATNKIQSYHASIFCSSFSSFELYTTKIKNIYQSINHNLFELKLAQSRKQLYNIYNAMSNSEYKLIIDDEILELAVSTNKSPFKEIFSRQRYYDYKIQFSNDKIVALNEVFHMQICVKFAGELHFFYNLNNFPREELILKFKELKESSEDNVGIEKIFELTNSYQPIFLIYKQNDESQLSKEEINKYISNYVLFFFEKSEEEQQREDIKEPETKIEKEKLNKNHHFFKDTLAAMSKNKSSFVFVLVGGLIVEFAAALGYGYASVGKAVAAFFYGCILLGGTLTGFVFYDVFKRDKAKKRLLIILLVLYALGVLGGIGFYSVFANSKNIDIDPVPPLDKVMLTSFLISFGCAIIGAALSYLISKLLSKKQK